MKIGVSYNVFDGVELLKDAISYVREYVDFISVVAQKRSNFGEELTEKEIKILEDLFKEGYINDLYYYNPDVSLSAHGNEITKRNLAIQICENNGCTHVMVSDCDEIYDNDSMEYLVNFHRENPEKVSYCSIDVYYYNHKYKIVSNSKLHVSNLFPVKYRFGRGVCRERVDPTRIVNVRNHELVEYHSNEDVVMHHYTYVRKDMIKKMRNSSGRESFFRSRDKFDKFLEYYNNFEEKRIAKSVELHDIPFNELENPVITLKYYQSY